MYYAGTASIAITPESPMWLAGFAVRTEPSKERLSELYAKALALKWDDDQPLVIVTMDLIAVSRDIAGAVARDVLRRHGLPRHRLLFAISHTHYGPEVRPDKAPFFHIPPEYARKIDPYADGLKTKLVALIDDALSNMEPVQLFSRRGTATFGHNRRPQNADPIVDHDVPVLEVTDAKTGARRAIVFGYACHNTTIPPEDRRFCGDWAGFAQEHLQNENPGAVALFITGAAADQNPDPRGSVDHSRRHGRALADAVTAALSSPAAREVSGPIASAFDEVPLEFLPVPPREQLIADATSDDVAVHTKAAFLLRATKEGRTLPTSYPCPVHAVGFGNELLLIALGGEPVVDWAVKFKSHFAPPHVWVAGYCNDMFGYLPTARVQREGGYEGGRAMLWSALPMPFTEDCEQRVTDSTLRLISQIWTSTP
ncbi:MAG: hypothetical protein M3478_13390 [Planctomycetota bacterium]|nr:hypothetical protein [Planctomycetota bacterium]